MKHISTLSTFVLAGALATLLGGTAVFADAASYKQLQDSVGADLKSMNIPATDLDMLTTKQLLELTGVLGSGDTPQAKAAAAEYMLDNFTHPTKVTLDSDAGKAMVADLAAQLKAIGVPYPPEAMTASQVQSLLNVFKDYQTPDKIPQQKQAIEAVLGRINRPADVTATNAGVMQLEAQVDQKLIALGITPPEVGTMTFGQIGQLQGAFDTNASPDEMKSKAMKILNIN